MKADDMTISHMENADILIDSPRIDSELEDFYRKIIINQGCSGLILNVKGLIISGFAISAKEYFRLLGDSYYEAEISASHSTAEAQAIKDSYYKYAEEYYTSDNYTLENIPFNFLHMKETKIWSGVKRFDVGLWRGKMDQIDGFSYGTLQVPERG